MPRQSLWHRATSRIHLPLFTRAEETISRLSYTGRGLFILFATVATASSAGLLYTLNSELVIAAPARGGSLTEGIVGSPRFINPVLAASDADRDLSVLVYSGLLRATPEGGYVPDLATQYTVSPDGKTYTFVIRSDAVFHNGTPVTADDVAFTVQKIQDPGVHSPLRANWEGVAVAVLDSHTVSFTLKSAYAPFVENLTLGVLPKSLWQGVSNDEFPFSDLNTSPIGSGPYKVSGTSRSASGIPSAYTLSSFNRYALGEPYISKLIIKSYQSEEALAQALANGEVESGSGISPASVSDLPAGDIRTAPLNRIFGVFFNENQSAVLRLPEVRTALSMAVDRQALVSSVLAGFGVPLTGPVPPALTGEEASSTDEGTTTPPLRAQQYLVSHGWKLDAGVLTKTTGSGKSAKSVTLQFTLATADVPELRAAAEFLKNAWGQMGAQAQVQVYDQGDLSQNVIRPRKYDALLFGEVVGRELDLFAFWHSSQRNDPGLNIALYANTAVDKALESLRTTQSESERADLLKKVSAQIEADAPAVFLYAPDFVYSIPNDIAGVDLGYIETPSDRFLSVASWHRETDYVWPLFNSK